MIQHLIVHSLALLFAAVIVVLLLQVVLFTPRTIYAGSFAVGSNGKMSGNYVTGVTTGAGFVVNGPQVYILHVLLLESKV
jgi:hypothetical protein